MEFNDYQKQAEATALYPDKGNNFVYPALGLADEAGEVVGKIKKLMRDKNTFTPAELTEESRTELKKEIGDVLWYIAALSRELGLDMEDIAQTNLAKLSSRKARATLHGDGDNR